MIKETQKYYMPLKDILYYMRVCVCVIAMQPKKSPEVKFVCVCCLHQRCSSAWILPPDLKN